MTGQVLSVGLPAKVGLFHPTSRKNQSLPDRERVQSSQVETIDKTNLPSLEQRQIIVVESMVWFVLATLYSIIIESLGSLEVVGITCNYLWKIFLDFPQMDSHCFLGFVGVIFFNCLDDRRMLSDKFLG